MLEHRSNLPYKKFNLTMVDLYPTRCNICQGQVKLIDNYQIYGKSYGSGKAYKCCKCGAYVGTHINQPRKALGVLANEQMRKGKQICHQLFDRHWNNALQRTSAYKRLARQMNIAQEDCHFGYFNLDQLRIAYKILKQW